MGVWSQVGKRVIWRLRFAGPTSAVRRGSSEVGGSSRGGSFAERGVETNSVKDGPALSRSRKVVGRRRIEGLCSGASVANEREDTGCTKGGFKMGEEYRQRSWGNLGGILYASFQK